MKHGDTYTEVFPYGTEINWEMITGLKMTGIINPGESFLYVDGEWNDMSERKDSLILAQLFF